MDINVDAVPVTLTPHRLLGDVSVFRHPSHTSDAPFLVSFKRREGTNGAADRLIVQVTHGKVDADGIPLSKNLISEVHLYIPDGYDTTDVDAVTSVVEGLVNSTTLNTFGTNQAIPMS